MRTEPPRNPGRFTPVLGFNPALRFAGPIDDLVPAQIGEDLLAVLREALTNTARHVAARSVDATITTDPAQITLQVTDDGTGLDPPTRGAADWPTCTSEPPATAAPSPSPPPTPPAPD